MKRKEHKENLLNIIASECEKYSKLFLVKISHPLSKILQEVRKECRPGNLFLGKNRVMVKGIEKYSNKEQNKEIMKLVPKFKQGLGIYFSNDSFDDIQKKLKQFKEEVYANEGDVSLKTIIIPVGQIFQEQESCLTYIEPKLRKEGMKTYLEKGIVLNKEEFIVCTAGKEISQKSANILRLLKIKVSVFKIEIVAYYSEDKVSFLIKD